MTSLFVNRLLFLSFVGAITNGLHGNKWFTFSMFSINFLFLRKWESVHVIGIDVEKKTLGFPCFYLPQRVTQYK